MDPENDSLAPRLTDDLVLEVLFRLPYKSFCRFKCVCRDWLALSSDPHYCRKSLKIPTGLLYQHPYSSAIKLASLPHNYKEFDVSFIPKYEQLELMDSCNGLVLCKYKGCITPLGTDRFIVCNPATREWRMLPDTPHKGHDIFYKRSILAFSPSWSAKFCVLNFKRRCPARSPLGRLEFQLFLSDHSTWFASWIPRASISERHMFIDGVLYLRTDLHEILALKSFEEPSSGISPTVQTIELPHENVGFKDRFGQHCFGQSSGALHYALPEEDARTIHIWSLDVDDTYEWSLKYRLSMSHAFGRDNLCQYDAHSWKCDYDVITLDLEGDGLLLFDKRADKFRLYKISTGELSEIQAEDLRLKWHVKYKYCHYVPSYSKLPALTM